jgi:hypothetical protein
MTTLEYGHPGEYIALVLALTVLIGNLVLAGVNRRKR